MIALAAWAAGGVGMWTLAGCAPARAGREPGAEVKPEAEPRSPEVAVAADRGPGPEGGAAVGAVPPSGLPRLARLGAVAEDRGPIEAGKVSGQGAGSLAYAAWAAGDAERLLMLREPAGDGTVSVRRAPVRAGAIAPDLGRLSELSMVTLPDGTVAIARSVERSEGVATDFDPPMVLVPGRLARGERVEQDVRLTVRPLGNPEQVRNAGAGRRVVEYVGDERVRTPAGEFAARRLRTTLTGNLGGPELRVTVDLWYADGVGLVAEDSRERVTVFGLEVRKKDERWALERADGSAAEALRAALKSVRPAE